MYIVYWINWKNNNANRIFCYLCIYLARNITNNKLTYEDFFGTVQCILVGMAGNMTLNALRLPGGAHGKTMCSTLSCFWFNGDNLWKHSRVKILEISWCLTFLWCCYQSWLLIFYPLPSHKSFWRVELASLLLNFRL